MCPCCPVVQASLLVSQAGALDDNAIPPRGGSVTKEFLMEAYCLKCKTQREMKGPTPVTMKNGKPATNGTCSVCGTKMFKIGKA